MPVERKPTDAIRRRDDALERLRTVNRLVTTAAVGLVVGFSALAADATSSRQRSAPTPPTETSDRSTGAPVGVHHRAHARVHRHHHHHHHVEATTPSTRAAVAPLVTPAPTPAPIAAPQPPVVVSGGS